MPALGNHQPTAPLAVTEEPTPTSAPAMTRALWRWNNPSTSLATDHPYWFQTKPDHRPERHNVYCRVSDMVPPWRSTSGYGGQERRCGCVQYLYGDGDRPNQITVEAADPNSNNRPVFAERLTPAMCNTVDYCSLFEYNPQEIGFFENYNNAEFVSDYMCQSLCSPKIFDAAEPHYAHWEPKYLHRYVRNCLEDPHCAMDWNRGECVSKHEIIGCSRQRNYKDCHAVHLCQWHFAAECRPANPGNGKSGEFCRLFFSEEDCASAGSYCVWVDKYCAGKMHDEPRSICSLEGMFSAERGKCGTGIYKDCEYRNGLCDTGVPICMEKTQEECEDNPACEWIGFCDAQSFNYASFHWLKTCRSTTKYKDCSRMSDCVWRPACTMKYDRSIPIPDSGPTPEPPTMPPPPAIQDNHSVLPMLGVVTLLGSLVFCI